MSLRTLCNRLPGNTHETAQLYTCVMSRHIDIGIVYIGCVCYIMGQTEYRRYIVVTTGFVPIKEIIHFNYCKLRIQFIIYWGYRTSAIELFELRFAYSSGRAVWGVGLRSVDCWVCGFEFLQWHVNQFLLRLCMYVSSWWLVQRSSTSVVCLSVIVAPRK